MIVPGLPGVGWTAMVAVACAPFRDVAQFGGIAASAASAFAAGAAAAPTATAEASAAAVRSCLKVPQ